LANEYSKAHVFEITNVLESWAQAAYWILKQFDAYKFEQTKVNLSLWKNFWFFSK